MSARQSLALFVLVAFCAGYLVVQSLAWMLVDQIPGVLMAFVDSLFQAVDL